MSTASLLLPVLVAGALAAGCASSSAPVNPALLIKVPPRAETAGDALLALMPSGADIALEIDLTRLRQNEVLGPVIERVLAGADTGVRAPVGIPLTAYAQVDAVLLCAYEIGTDSAATITLVRGADPSAFGPIVAPGIAAMGPPALVARVKAVARGETPSLAKDRELLSIRTRAMPAKAEGAAVRMAARLGFDARVGLAAQLDLDAVPRSLSLWGDVADDLAVVLVLEGESKAEAARLAKALGTLRDRASAEPWLRRRLLHIPLLRMDIAIAGRDARTALIIGPRLLAHAASRLLQQLSSPSEHP